MELNERVSGADETRDAQVSERVKEAFERVRIALDNSVEAARADVDRVNGIIRSATGEMMASFSALGDLTAAQRGEMESALNLVRSLSGGTPTGGAEGTASDGLHGFIEEAHRTLSSLTDLIANFSKENIKVAYTVEDLVRELGTVFDLVGEVDIIADDTSLLAINAALEAARAGDSGRGFGVVSAEVRKLSNDTKRLNERISKHVGDANTLVEQVQRAVLWMSERDLGLERTVAFGAEVRSLLERVGTLNDETENLLRKLTNLSSELDQNVSDAMRALQFEDMATQINRAALERLGGVIKGLQDAIEAADPNLAPDQLALAIAETFEAGLQQVDSDHHMPATQDDIGAGDAFLF